VLLRRPIEFAVEISTEALELRGQHDGVGMIELARRVAPTRTSATHSAMRSVQLVELDAAGSLPLL
jgi:hypothetical protein